MMARDKYYAVALSLLLTWLFHPILLVAVLSVLIYTHPFSSPIFYYIDKQIEIFLPVYHPNLKNNPPLLSTTIIQPDSLDLYFCKQALKSGKRCRQPPVINGFCKRHHQPNPPTQ